MRSISVTMNVSLDGVVQGVGRPDEDIRGGFTHGGWGTWHQDDVLAREMGKGMSRPGDMLLGRRTWQDFIAAWGHREDGNPFTTHLNAVTKYVVSTTLADADAWQNSVLLRGDATQTVAELKAQDATTWRSSAVRRWCAICTPPADSNHYTLVIHPITLGMGSRMFEGPAPLTKFTLTGSVTTTKGVIVAHYDRR